MRTLTIFLILFVFSSRLSIGAESKSSNLQASQAQEDAFNAYPIARYHRIKKRFYKKLMELDPQDPRRPMQDMKSAWDYFHKLYRNEPTRTEVLSFQTKKYHIRGRVDYDAVTSTYFLSIAGTEKMLHLVLDLNLKPIFDSFLGAHLHKGFRDGAVEVFQHVKDYIKPGVPLKITGHSMGGAVAQVLSMILMKKQGFDDLCVYTIGQPLVSFPGVQDEYPGLSQYRIYLMDDPVPRVPKFMGYQHFGESIELPGKRHNSIQDPSQINSTPWFWHHTYNYDSSIQEIYRRVMSAYQPER